MSRTIRRKNALKYDPHHHGWMKDSVWLKSKYGGEYHTRVKVTGEEHKRRLAKFHSDHYYRCNIGNTPWSYRNVDHRRHRVKVRTVIANYLHNSEYVIMVRAQPRWDYWD
jgi:hypothetical protein